MNPNDVEQFFRAAPGLAAISAMTWLLARTFLRAESRRDYEYKRLTSEIDRKDAIIDRKDLIILRLESEIEELRERNKRGK